MIGAPFFRLGWLLSVSGVWALAQTSISLNPQQLSLAAPAGSTARATQTMSVITTGQNATFTASAQQAGSSIPWLSVSPVTGTTPASLTITADASNLPAGTYLGQVAVRAGNVGAVANVTFTVGAPTGGGLLADHSSLTFVSQSAGDGPSSRMLTVTSTQGSSSAVKFEVGVSSPGNWLSVFPLSGTTPATLTVTATRTPILLGDYTGSITLTTQGASPTVVPVTLLARSTVDEAPTIKLSEDEMRFVHQRGLPLGSQSVGITISSGTQEYTASTTAPWLNLFSPFNPTLVKTLTDYAPGQLGVRVDPTGLAAGFSDRGTITISSPGAQSRTLSVDLSITETAALRASPSALSFEEAGASIKYVSVSSTSTPINFNVVESPPVPWLSIAPTSGIASSTEALLLSITGDSSGLGPGTYSTTLNLVGQNGSMLSSVSVRLIVPTTSDQLGPSLVTPQSSIDLKGFVGSANLQQTLTVTSSDASTTHRFSTEVSSAGGWLTAAPSSGVTPSLLTITANMAAISTPGTYIGSVLLTSLLTGEQQIIPVNLEVAAQVVTATPASLTFTQQEGGGSPASQTVEVSAVRQAAFVVSSSAGWVTATPDRLVTPGTLTVSVNSSGLAPGTYQANIQLTGTEDRLSIPVSLTVPGPPSPTASPQAVTFTYRLGSPAPAAQAISVGSTGRAVTYRATATTESGVKWLSVSPDAGSTPGMVSTSVNPALLVPGRHTGAVTIARSDAAASPVTVPVTLNVTTSSVAVGQVLNAASLAPTAVAPGQIVTITGSGLGPATGLSATPTAAGAIESRLGTVRVFFDDVPAPLLFVRADQINAIVPYAVYGRLSARVQVVEGENYSIPIEAKVAEAAPALFTTGPMGRGQAAALNSDLTVNSLANPVARGGVITIYGTGEGQTDPQGQDGRLILTDLRRPLLPVTATIGGRPATILYAGSAPTLVSGVFQVNLRVPEDVGPGAAAVQIQVGGASTQSGVTIAVR